MKRQFHIHHAINPTFDETEVQLRKYVGFVNAESLNEAFLNSQNHNLDWQKNKTRSTSVGDVIQDGDKLFLVKSIGFKELTAVIEPEEIRQQYVFKYLRLDKTLIGYHLDSLCSTGPKERAKIYNCTAKRLSRQLETISTNLKYQVEKDEGFFKNLLPPRKDFMEGLKFNEILLIPELI